MKSPAQGAVTTVRVGVVADADVIGGRYCEDCHVGEVPTDDAVVASAFGAAVRTYAFDPGAR